MVGSEARPRSADDALVPNDRILTIPNVLSCLRLLLIPLFVWLALGPEADGWAFAVLAVSAVTDFLDGKIARHYQIVS